AVHALRGRLGDQLAAAVGAGGRRPALAFAAPAGLAHRRGHALGRLGVLRYVVGQRVVRGGGGREHETLADVDQVRVGDRLVVLVVEVLPVVGVVVVAVRGGGVPRLPGGGDGDGSRRKRVERGRGGVRPGARGLVGGRRRLALRHR